MPSTAPASVSIAVPSVQQIETPFKRPAMPLIKFDGSVGQWLQFWSHFQKYDEDQQLNKVDKLRYLKMSMVDNSKADLMIKDYPMCADSYDKAITSLKDRFGRKKLLIQYYVRRLLVLIIQNASEGKKVNLSAVYDQISAHIRCLESLGIEMDKLSVFLYPLVESSLSEETLRAWQRSSLNRERSGDIDDDDLDKLLKFLRLEVEGDGDISLAIKGFAGENESRRREKTAGQPQLKEK